MTLANVLAATKPSGAVAACGLAGGPDLPATVMPFILRDVTLIGVDSVHVAREERAAVWERIAGQFTEQDLRAMATDAPMGDLPQLSQDILAGKIRGRVVIDIHAG